MASFYERHVLPHLIGCACGAGPIRRRRAKIVPQASGRVLELGIGGGLNLAFYDLAQVNGVFGVDPSQTLRAKARTAPRAPGLKVEILDGLAEDLSFDSANFDTGRVHLHPLLGPLTARRLGRSAARAETRRSLPVFRTWAGAGPGRPALAAAHRAVVEAPGRRLSSDPGRDAGHRRGRVHDRDDRVDVPSPRAPRPGLVEIGQRPKGMKCAVLWTTSVRGADR